MYIIKRMPEFDQWISHLRDRPTRFRLLRRLEKVQDPGELSAALGHIARARGMAEIARLSGIRRESLYKALRPNSHPRFDTIQRVCKALGVKLTAVVSV